MTVFTKVAFLRRFFLGRDILLFMLAFFEVWMRDDRAYVVQGLLAFVRRLDSHIRRVSEALELGGVVLVWGVKKVRRRFALQLD